MTAVIAVAPQLQENVGALARAMANFALGDLRLVAPRHRQLNAAAYAMAAGADAVLDRARVFDHLSEALADITFAAAYTARPRDLRQRLYTPRTAAPLLQGPGTAMVFGPERTGLSADNVALCHGVVHVPTSPAFRSLNLAQCVLLACYERFAALTDVAPPPPIRNHEPAAHDDLHGLFTHLEAELDEAGFFHPPAKRQGMIRKLRTVLLRADLSDSEVKSARGMVRALTGKRKAERA